MKNIVTKLLGSSPRTSIIGILIAVGVSITPFLSPENQKIETMILAVLGAIYARVSKDSNGVTAEEGKEVQEMVTAKKSL